ncbi:hypothetical protein DPMN_057696 [Dreissena polymorpha]|uniref:Uncharacterized protein n=1 Tax=Dreissena polymorpha TaxID=45954 RepID=A0A9D4HEJ9_DREPO|nr:hypothetical protein DPMN_057696 [Dreissena polymorpha]
MAHCPFYVLVPALRKEAEMVDISVQSSDLEREQRSSTVNARLEEYWTKYSNVEERRTNKRTDGRTVEGTNGRMRDERTGGRTKERTHEGTDGRGTNERTDGRKRDERTDGRTNGITKERTDGRTKERKKERTDERTDGRTKERTNGRTYGPTDERITGLRKRRTNARTNGITKERTDARRNGRTKERTNERRNGRTKERTHDRTDRLTGERTNGRTKRRRTDERTAERRNERTDARRTNERTDEQTSARTFKRHNEETNGRTNRRTEERKKGRTDESFKPKSPNLTCGTSGDSTTRSCHTAAVLDEFFRQKSKQEVPVPVAPAPLVRFVTAPAYDLALTSSISVPAEPYSPYSTKHYRNRKLEAEQSGEFRRQYNKKLSYRTCNRRIIPTDKFKPEVPVPVAPAPLVRFVTAPAPDLALTFKPYLTYSAKHYRKRKLEAEQAGEFRRQYNKKLNLPVLCFGL